MVMLVGSQGQVRRAQVCQWPTYRADSRLRVTPTFQVSMNVWTGHEVTGARRIGRRRAVRRGEGQC